MKIDQIKAAMDGQSVTNGWDALCAFNAAQVSSIFFQQYLQEGPTHPALPLRAIVQQDGTDFWILDLRLGPPEVSFSADLNLQQCQVQMFLVKGVLVNFYAAGKQPFIKSVLRVRPNESWLTGAVNLAQVSGTENQLGNVTVDLASGAYQPQVSGIDPASTLATQIGTAVQTFFENNHVAYPLGVIAISGVPECLQPTTFDFATQPAPEGKEGDGCVLVFIQTNGSKGALGQLNPYPIPAGYTAALLVSSQVIFNRLMPPFLNQIFQNVGTTFNGQQSNGGWKVVGSGGSLNVGVIGDNSGHDPYSSDSSTDIAPVVAPADGFTIAPQGGSLLSSWDKQWNQWWTYWYGTPDGNGGVIWSQMAGETSVTGTYSILSAPTVDPVSDIVSFNGNGSATLNPTDPPSWWESHVDPQYQVEAHFQSSLVSILQSTFSQLQIPSVNVLALSSILFPSRYDALSLTEAAVPCDLLVSGQVASALTVSPPTVNLQPGGTQQFTASLSGQPTSDVTWEIKPENIGSIDASGVYRAPASIDDAQAVVITAINNKLESNTASAMVLVYEPPPSTGLLINPGELLLTQGSPGNLLVTDETGKAVDADCSLQPDLGTIAKDWGIGQWLYLPPETIEEATTVTVTAVSTGDSSKTGIATIQLAPIETVTITPASADLTVNQAVMLKASGTNLDKFTWVIYPTGSGSLQPDPDDSSMVTYVAPSSVSSEMQVMVAAYSLDGSVGIGLAQINLAA